MGDVVSGIDSAATQMSDIATTLTVVSQVTRERTGSAATASSEASGNVQTAAHDLTNRATELRTQISDFLISVAAA